MLPNSLICRLICVGSNIGLQTHPYSTWGNSEQCLNNINNYTDKKRSNTMILVYINTHILLGVTQNNV